MSETLVIAELSAGKLRRTTHSAITFARQVSEALGGGYGILAMGSGLDAAIEELAKLGASKVLVADEPSLENYLAERYVRTVASVAKDHAVVVATASAFGKDLMPRVAGRLGAGYAADITEFVCEGGHLVYKRPMYAGNAFGLCRIRSDIEIVTVRQSSFAPAEPVAGTSPVEQVELVAASRAAEGIEWVEFDQIQSERPELAEAETVVAGGRGCKAEFYRLLDPLADRFQAAIGATRAACDAGWAAPDLQVGQTGKIVAPKLYFAVGLSGAIQHLAGMKSSKVIVAINKDPEAPIFEVADYGLVDDLFKAVPELVEQLKAARDA